MANYQDKKNTAHNVAEPVAEYGIPVAVRDIWHAIQALSPSNKRWLADKLIEPSISTASTMPCVFTDEEWEEELLASELEGEATQEETQKFYDKWGIAI